MLGNGIIRRLSTVKREKRDPAAVETRSGTVTDEGTFLAVAGRTVRLFLIVDSVALLVAGHTEYIEWVLYAISFAVLLPGLIVVTTRAARHLDAAEIVAWRAGGAVNASATVALVAALRIAWAAGLTGSGALWLMLTAAAAVELALASGRSVQLGSWVRAVARPTSARTRTLAATVAVVVTLLVFLPTRMFTAPRLGASVVLALILVGVVGVARRRLTVRNAFVDVVVALGLILFVPITAFAAAQDVYDPNFFLGPMNGILHGHAMLVDIFSQYGVGLFYAMAGALAPVGIGYGTFQLLLTTVTLLWLVVVYAALRLAFPSPWPGVAAIVGIAIAGLYTGDLLWVQFPSTGPLRFGMPVLILFAAVWAERSPDRSRRWLLASVVVALSSLWSFETFFYTACAFTAARLFSVRLGGATRRQLWSELRIVLAGIGAAQLSFAIATRIAAGSWPNWIEYWRYIGLYSVQRFGSASVTPWSPGFLLAAFYLFSAAALVLLSLSGQDRPGAQRLRPALVAAAAANGMGFATFTYFLDRSVANNLHHVAFPAVILLAIWLGIAAASGSEASHARTVLLVAGAAALSCVVIDGSSQIREKWPSTEIGVLTTTPPPASIRTVYDDFRRQWTNPVVQPHAALAVDLLRRYASRDRRPLVLLKGELGVEVLIRSGRVEPIPLFNPDQDSLNPWVVEQNLRKAAALPTGTLLLTNMYPGPVPSQPPGWLPNIVADIYRTVERSFRLEPLHREGGLTVLRLERRSH